MEVSVTIAENEKKLFGKQCRTAKDDRAEKNHDTSNSSIQVAQFVLVLTTGKSRNENVRQHVHQDGENHGETSERSDFRHRSRVTPKKGDQEHGDLSLKTIEQRVRSQTFDQPHNLASIVRVFVCL